MIIVVSDNNLEEFEEKLVKTNNEYNATDVNFDSYGGVYIARFTVDQLEKGCFKINNKKNSYVCKKCGSFLFERLDDGFFEMNSKIKKYYTNGRMIRTVCRCGEKREEKF